MIAISVIISIISRSANIFWYDFNFSNQANVTKKIVNLNMFSNLVEIMTKVFVLMGKIAFIPTFLKNFV
jgi:hypothetical protein